jgi:hypothetical protein
MQIKKRIPACCGKAFDAQQRTARPLSFVHLPKSLYEMVYGRASFTLNDRFKVIAKVKGGRDIAGDVYPSNICFVVHIVRFAFHDRADRQSRRCYAP